MVNLQKISKDPAVFVYTQDPNHALWFCDDIIGIQKRKVVVKGKSSEVMNEENLSLIYDRECKNFRVKRDQIYHSRPKTIWCKMIFT